MEEKNTSTKEYKKSLNKEELEKFNSQVDHLLFLDAAYRLNSQPRQPRRGIIIYFPVPEKEEKDDKMED